VFKQRAYFYITENVFIIARYMGRMPKCDNRLNFQCLFSLYNNVCNKIEKVCSFSHQDNSANMLQLHFT